MPAIARLGDIASGHESFPPTNTIEGASTCDVNSRPVHCVGHAIASHGSPSPSPVHSRALASGSSTCDVESRAMGHIGASVGCGGLIVTGSSDTDVD